MGKVALGDADGVCGVCVCVRVCDAEVDVELESMEEPYCTGETLEAADDGWDGDAAELLDEKTP